MAIEQPLEKNEEVTTEECSPKTPGPCGRPRSEASRVALLETAYGLMVDFPLASISTQQIASKAGVSTATVYRWWPTKEALLLDALLYAKEREGEPSQEGTPLQRLREYIVSFARSLEGKQGRVVSRVLTAIQDDEKLREAFTQRLYLPRCGKFRSIAQEAMEAGELPPETDIDLLLDMVFGTILARLLVRHQVIKVADIQCAFDMAVAGARKVHRKR